MPETATETKRIPYRPWKPQPPRNYRESSAGVDPEAEYSTLFDCFLMGAHLLSTKGVQRTSATLRQSVCDLATKVGQAAEQIANHQEYLKGQAKLPAELKEWEATKEEKLLDYYRRVDAWNAQCAHLGEGEPVTLTPEEEEEYFSLACTA